MLIFITSTHCSNKSRLVQKLSDDLTIQCLNRIERPLFFDQFTLQKVMNGDHIAKRKLHENIHIRMNHSVNETTLWMKQVKPPEIAIVDRSPIDVLAYLDIFQDLLSEEIVDCSFCNSYKTLVLDLLTEYTLTIYLKRSIRYLKRQATLREYNILNPVEVEFDYLSKSKRSFDHLYSVLKKMNRGIKQVESERELKLLMSSTH